MDWTPTPEQVERGLTDTDGLVRMVWARRTDYTPTVPQVERGITDSDWDVVMEWMQRTDILWTEALRQKAMQRYPVAIQELLEHLTQKDHENTST